MTRTYSKSTRYNSSKDFKVYQTWFFFFPQFVHAPIEEKISGNILDKFQDPEIWQALDDVLLRDFFETLEVKLDHELLEHGAVVSVVERS